MTLEKLKTMEGFRRIPAEGIMIAVLENRILVERYGKEAEGLSFPGAEQVRDEALLLTGEWGCGKTYLIDNDLAEALRDTHFTAASNNPHGRARNMRTSFWKTNS